MAVPTMAVRRISLSVLGSIAIPPLASGRDAMVLAYKREGSSLDG